MVGISNLLSVSWQWNTLAAVVMHIPGESISETTLERQKKQKANINLRARLGLLSLDPTQTEYLKERIFSSSLNELDEFKAICNALKCDDTFIKNLWYKMKTKRPVSGVESFFIDDEALIYEEGKPFVDEE